MPGPTMAGQVQLRVSGRDDFITRHDRTALQDAKARIPFRELVEETHDINRDGKTLCPAHKDTRPSCHIYPDGAYCYTCQWNADHVTWLQVTRNLSAGDAIREVKRRAGLPAGTTGSLRTRSAEPSGPTLRGVDWKPWNALQVAELERLSVQDMPAPLAGRGFTLTDLQALGIVSLAGAAGLPIRTPCGRVAALKLRNPHDRPRYQYWRGTKQPDDTWAPWPTAEAGTIPAPHNPAWCSPAFHPERPLIVMEGELNAAITWAALEGRADLIGAAGTTGRLYLSALTGRDVLVYADGDTAGEKALNTWARTAQAAGASRVRKLSALPGSLDACDLAGQYGQEAIRQWLVPALEGGQS